MKVGIIQFPGTNCVRESCMAVHRSGMESIPLLWNEHPARLESCDGYVIAGGFSYEDRSRSGIIAALDPIMDIIKKAAYAGKPVLGICNGAQILVEALLVPGFKSSLPAAALTTNKRVAQGQLIGTGFYNAWVNLRCELHHGEMDSRRTCAFTSKIVQGEVLRIPAAHAEGRFIMPDHVLQSVKDLNLIPFRYSDAEGSIDPSFPVNPNGSVDNIAALTNYAGNVMAIMPHPERTPAGDALFASMRSYLESSKVFPVSMPPVPESPAVSLDQPDSIPAIKHYRPGPHTAQVVTELIITDNAAVSVETTLQQLGIPVTVKRRMHWELSFAQDIPDDAQQASLNAVHASGELYNANKERLAEAEGNPSTWSLLVRERDDVMGLHALQALTSWFSIEGITSVHSGIIWDISGYDQPVTKEMIQDVLDSHILMNQYAHRGLWYEG